MKELTRKEKQTIFEALWYAQTLVYPEARIQPDAVERGQAALRSISKNWRTKYFPYLTEL